MNDKSVRSIVFVAAFTALIIIGAIFSFPVPWNPAVPFTLATMFVILSGMILGPWLGLAAVGLYLLLGIMGLPVFAQGRGGLNVLIGPTGGFLIGYALSAFVAGLFVRTGRGRMPFIILGAFVGILLVYIPGFPWMHFRLMGMVDNWSWASSWNKYTAPFLIVDGLKAAAAVLIASFLKDRIHYPEA